MTARAGQSIALITGGAGFVGANLANRLLEAGERVRIFDNLSRPGVERNVSWLRERHDGRVQFELGDVRDAQAVREAVRGVSSVFHFAAQVAVTTSLVDPIDDFETNGRGTLNVLEAIRAQDTPPPLLFTSTNKVYGALSDLALRGSDTRYEPVDDGVRARGVSEARPLEFHSPYGCSKGTADQYVLDWAHTFGLSTAVFRMSCIYGPRQFGTEDQGWVAHFLIRALQRQTITIYGDGKQVRDILFVDDLVDAFLRARAALPAIAGQAFNIGGGPASTISLRELLAKIEPLTGRAPSVEYEAWRTADQRYYVSDAGKFQRATGWRPRVGVDEGLARLHEWLREASRPAQALEGAPRIEARG